MWPFTKTIEAPTYPVQNQLAMAIKSLSVPQATAKWSLFPQGQKQWSTQTAIDEGYNGSSIVYACVEKRAKLIASIPMFSRFLKNPGVPQASLVKNSASGALPSASPFVRFKIKSI